MKIIATNQAFKKPSSDNKTVVVSIEEVGKSVRNFKIFKHLFTYDEAQVWTYDFNFIPKFIPALLIRLLSRGACSFCDEQGKVLRINLSTLARFARNYLVDYMQTRKLLRQCISDISKFEQDILIRKSGKKVDLSCNPVYLRVDILPGTKAGGSLSHIAGVVNNFERFTKEPIFLYFFPVPRISKKVDCHKIDLPLKFVDFSDFFIINSNKILFEEGAKYLSGKKISFVYQRYSKFGFSGAKLAHYMGVPFILEYNSSPIWTHRNWASVPLKYEKIVKRVEALNFNSANLIVVVSEPLKAELIKKGVPASKILVNYNGVDPDLYSPLVDGSEIRKKHELDNKITICFIGTFGRWHGAEILADAFGRMIKARPRYREKICLLMVGDGVTMPEVKKKIDFYGIKDMCILTGAVPQEDGPKYLAASDILVSPHVPNPDGSRFFGSPIKLYEYMAMGKGIVASDLDQIGEVLEHNYSACLVKPGDPEDLANGMMLLIENENLRKVLGKHAREEILNKHTWEGNVKRLIDRLTGI